MWGPAHAVKIDPSRRPSGGTHVSDSIQKLGEHLLTVSFEVGLLKTNKGFGEDAYQLDPGVDADSDGIH